MLTLPFAVLGQAIAAALAAKYCPGTESEIQTDRPDVTNSSFVAPTGRLQAEKGINLTALGVSRRIDGTNTRIRAGVAHCTKLLVDLLDYSHSVTMEARLGFRTSCPLSTCSLDRFPPMLCSPRQPVWASPPGRAGSLDPGYNPYIQFP